MKMNKDRDRFQKYLPSLLGYDIDNNITKQHIYGL